ncbi:DUF6259 domain-containing protein, partial [Streptococcus pneumoniae]|uniref:DUF6259 domain-containing protein n=1 Tax=Streptococcus pneumoniae TaxID=1313 RepID=UPI0018B02548
SDVVAWQVLRVPEKSADEWARSMEEVSALLGVTVGVHFYDWHEVPFDTSYPDYFPARADFPRLVQRMRSAGIRTMPYI